MGVPYIIYALSCQHKVSAPSSLVSGCLHCPICRDDFPIADIEVMEYRANCRNCRYARWAGMSEETGEVFANGHVRRNPGHMVSVNQEQNLEAVKTKAKFYEWRILSES